MPETIKPFARQGKYTVVDNVVLDYIMPKLSGSAWKVLSFIIRKTIGWHKDSDSLSASQIMAGTGITSDRTITEACKELEEIGCIIIIREVGRTNYFILNQECEIVVETPAKIAGVPPQKLRTQNIDSKHREEEEEGRVDNLGTKELPPGSSKDDPEYSPIDENGDDLRDLGAEALLLRIWRCTFSHKLRPNKPDKKYYSKVNELKRRMSKDKRFAEFLDHQIRWCYNDGAPRMSAPQWFNATLEPTTFEVWLNKVENGEDVNDDSTLIPEVDTTQIKPRLRKPRFRSKPNDAAAPMTRDDLFQYQNSPEYEAHIENVELVDL